MSAPAGRPDQEHFEKLFTVFDCSPPDDVSHARLLWSSLSLLPPLESRLVSSDIRQRLPVSRPQRTTTTTTTTTGPKQPSLEPGLRLEERRRYAAMADQRRETMALLRRQREQRMQKELVSLDFNPKMKSKLLKPPESETEEELVKQLQ
ncbi:cilia- and flagella-associated protein HOATZ [Anoplopoma fimbria]|uniref:cilia- and flagella-associated protein HOATZ n=1 Tax=Anoplopoma fimbria TaxID=229290 RepID=UPI0023ED1166|nr:cilia- and flagella-associated protein HOATZ [Anoplopoma fimbria]